MAHTTVILGPRQCGKTTLAKELLKKVPNSLYLDLERPSDLAKLSAAELFFREHSEKLICIDEIQRLPELFPLIRSVIDENRKPGNFLFLGSASRDLLQQTSETLAGRISYKHLTPLLWSEMDFQPSFIHYMFRGGFPLSLLIDSNSDSLDWRIDFISTFLERDLLLFSSFTPKTMKNLWTMLAHNNGQTLNLSQLGDSLGVSHVMVRRYVDLLESTFMVHQVSPWLGNSSKRLVKTPKVYVSDPGIVGALLGIYEPEELYGHPVFGSLWELIVLTEIKATNRLFSLSFYRTSNGNEIDFIVEYKGKTIAIECKASISPSVTAGFWNNIEDIKPDKTFVVAPVSAGYPLKENGRVASLQELVEFLKSM